jgi:hypothetical protein
MAGIERTKAERTARRETQRRSDRKKEEQNRRRSIGGGQPNELGILQGQNAEQGNTIDPRNVELARGSARLEPKGGSPLNRLRPGARARTRRGK